MSQPIITKVLILAGWLVASSLQARAEEVAAGLCGTLETVRGDVQVMDGSRSKVFNIAPGFGIPCGGWIRVESAPGNWAVIRHSEGQTVHLAADTFIQVSDSEGTGKDSGDQIILYRGEIFVQGHGGERELRVLTANARARLIRGMMLVIYSVDEENTQLIALENRSTLENRFRTERSIVVQEGEATSLSFSLLRVVPSTPKAVSVASLREKLLGFPVDDRVHSESIQAAFQRRERKFAAQLANSESGKAPRAPAAAPAGDKPHTIARKPSRSDAEGRKRWLEKIAGSAEGVKKFLGRQPASSGAARVEVLEEDKDEVREKRRLIEELSRIKAE